MLFWKATAVVIVMVVNLVCNITTNRRCMLETNWIFEQMPGVCKREGLYICLPVYICMCTSTTETVLDLLFRSQCYRSGSSMHKSTCIHVTTGKHWWGQVSSCAGVTWWHTFSSQASMKWKQRTLDVSRHNVTSVVAAVLASTASIITLTGGDPTETNYITVGSAVTTMWGGKDSTCTNILALIIWVVKNNY